jgi:DNA-binding SARP family transcriptional activator
MERWCRLNVLGELRLVHHGERLPLLPTAERLLAMMAVLHRGRRVRRAAVAERLWPDSTPGRAGSSLRSVLWRLPRPRGRMPVQSDATMLWLADGVEVDLWEAQDLAHAVSSAEAPSDAPDRLSLLAQDLLPDWAETWLALEQESFRQTRLHALESGAVLLCRRGRFTDALEAALAAVRAEPLRESAHRRVIEVHLAERNHAEALRQYDGYRRLLAAELGLPPSDTIRNQVAPLLGRPIDARTHGSPAASGRPHVRNGGGVRPRTVR